MKLILNPAPIPLGPPVPLPAPPANFEVATLIVQINDAGINPNAVRVSAVIALDPAGLIQLPIQNVVQPVAAGFDPFNSYLCPCHFIMGPPSWPGPFTLQDMAGIDLVTGLPVPPGSVTFAVHYLGQYARGVITPGRALDIKGVIKLDFSAVPTPLPTAVEAQGQMIGVGIYPLNAPPITIGLPLVPLGQSVYGLGGLYNLLPAVPGERKIFFDLRRLDGGVATFFSASYEAGGWPIEQPVNIVSRFPAIDFSGDDPDDIELIEVRGISPAPAGENFAFGVGLFPTQSEIPSGLRAVVPLPD